ncbi:hypothetical protein ABPG72_009497 [Tetrahymena utriculariae]
MHFKQLLKRLFELNFIGTFLKQNSLLCLPSKSILKTKNIPIIYCWFVLIQIILINMQYFFMIHHSRVTKQQFLWFQGGLYSQINQVMLSILIIFVVQLSLTLSNRFNQTMRFWIISKNGFYIYFSFLFNIHLQKLIFYDFIIQYYSFFKLTQTAENRLIIYLGRVQRKFTRFFQIISQTMIQFPKLD